ncbi:DUF881 domain-containing protein [Pengzhenrongella frigida]|uniref:DUF881 domain-containing protein n=1 Tax=Pengzhenrongella frigida TaxID=1259133 RepID=A0A4Q5N3V8_9MICO|nr:DUF881 domain-containing protein [Cellulomonas sp. HLT2-17]RYV50711.1 DUF881 domain-containing protein [Cellulomonas sp. HLT2-17]
MTTRPPQGAPPSPASARPVDASMTLLNEVMLKPLDPGYQQAADRRRAAGNPPVRPLHTAWHFLLAIALGLVTAAAAADLRAPEPAVAQARALLEEQIEERSAVAEQFEEDNAERTQEIAELQAAALGDRDPASLARVASDGVSSGAVAVNGPGLRLTVEDSAAAREDLERANPNERVQDGDLQVTVNGLWASGAEAIAINGHRLSAVTAIRSAGSAILVDLVPLSGPYVVEAIGDPADLETRFARTDAGQHLSTLRNNYGIGSRFSSEDSLELPAASSTRLWSARLPTTTEAGTMASSSPTVKGVEP